MDVAIGRSRVAAAILVILGWAAAAYAEDAPSAPAGTRSLADTPFQLVLPRGHLLGDWLGARTWLEDHGVYPSVTFVTDALGNPTGGKQQGFRGASNLGLDLIFDLGKLYGPAGGSFEISFSERFGSSLSPQSRGRGDRSGGGQPIHRRVRDLVGAGDVGAARRDVPQPDA